MRKRAAELKRGDKFPSPRETEGTVVAQCDYGKCEHGHSDRTQSIHVRGGSNEWFIALSEWSRIHVCASLEDSADWFSKCSPQLEDEHGDVVPHLMVNRWAG